MLAKEKIFAEKDLSAYFLGGYLPVFLFALHSCLASTQVAKKRESRGL